LTKGDTVSVLDIVQRHSCVSFGLGDILNKSGTIHIAHIASWPQGTKDPSVYIKVNVEGTRAVIDAAGVRRLVYTSSAGIVFNGTDVVKVDGRTSCSHKPFDMCSLLPCHSTTPSEFRLDPESTAATLNESLHRALSPICATTEYHSMMRSSMQTLSPYVTPAPNTESILSTFNTPFDPRELTDPFDCSRVEGRAFFVAVGGPGCILDFTGIYDEYERRLSPLKVQERSRQGRGIEDSCAELGSSIFLLYFVSYHLQLRYYRKVQCLQRSRSDIQVAAVWKCKATHENEHRTIKSKLHETIRRFYYEWGIREDGHLQRIAIAMQETMTNYEQRTCGGLGHTKESTGGY
ncbi:hypothetical protein F5J12DRAFT_954271, partial [Pisolithus orientalis]|uniref:uncharacterized protein n=1 Tax=Pisolithus orientalis TaxID=936130 RepID=UPI0022255269